jgi:hypothetical protein
MREKSSNENESPSDLGLFGTAFSALIGLILITAEARSGQSPTSTPRAFALWRGLSPDSSSDCSILLPT